VNKILHPPITALKSASGSDELTATADLLRTLFGVEDSQKATSTAAGLDANANSAQTRQSASTSRTSGLPDNELAAEKSTSPR
jgi:hypothetical protein